MLYQDVVEKIRKQFLKTDVSNYEGKLALQFNLTGKDGENGWFYMEILNGNLSIEEYTYDDRDAEITISGEDLIAIAEGKLDPYLAHTAGIMLINGDTGKALQIKMFAKQPKQKAAAEKKTETKKAPAKTVTKKSAAKKETKASSKKETKTAETSSAKAEAKKTAESKKADVKASAVKESVKIETVTKEAKQTSAKPEVKAEVKKEEAKTEKIESNKKETKADSKTLKK